MATGNQACTAVTALIVVIQQVVTRMLQVDIPWVQCLQQQPCIPSQWGMERQVMGMAVGTMGLAAVDSAAAECFEQCFV